VKRNGSQMKRFVLSLIALLTTVIAFAQPYPTKLTVAADGSGDYKTIQEAVNVVRAYCPEPITITIKNGIYKEKLLIPSWVTNITFIGESRDGTIITNDDYSGKFVSKDTVANKTKFSTFSSYTVWVQGNDVTIKNVTIRNTAGRVGQAVALHVDGDRFVIKDCNLLGNQDTLLTADDSTRQYYVNCFIEGTTDFIFGPATAIFQNCTIKSLSNSYITAASTPQWKKYGYVFMHCTLTAADEAQQVYLGRPWRAYARTVFMHCNMGKHIRAEGWHNWSKAENEKTAFYAEYNNSGEGASTAKRVPWSKQITKKEAKLYTIDRIFNGWKPAL
jgi:pectinesterase